MANITITVPDNVLNRVAAAIAARNNYNSLTDGTKAQFVKTVILRWMKAEVIGYEAGLAADAAKEAAFETAKSEISLS